MMTHSASILRWTRKLDRSLRRVYLWLEANRYDMHQFIDHRDLLLESSTEPSQRSDYTVALVYLRLLLFTDACHEYVSVVGYIVVLQGHFGTKVLFRWRSHTTHLTSTSSTYAELDGAHYGLCDFLPIWSLICKTLGAYIPAVLYIDNSAAITIIKLGFSKGLLWLSGVSTAQAATNKGRVLKIGWLHDIAAHIVRHTASAFMRADPLTKQLPQNEDSIHAQRSLQLYAQGKVKKRCKCLRCEGPNAFCKTRYGAMDIHR